MASRPKLYTVHKADGGNGIKDDSASESFQPTSIYFFFLWLKQQKLKFHYVDNDLTVHTTNQKAKGGQLSLRVVPSKITSYYTTCFVDITLIFLRAPLLLHKRAI